VKIQKNVLEKAKAINVAVPHMKIKTGGAGKAAPHAEYIAREGEYSKRLEKGERLESPGNGKWPKWEENNPLNFGKQPIYMSAKMAVPTVNLKLLCLENLLRNKELNWYKNG